MATVGVPRYGIEISYTNGATIKQWFATEQLRDKEHVALNGRKGKRLGVKTAKRISR